MVKIKNKQDCCGCGACAQACPVKCISMKTDNEGFWYPNVDLNICISCNKCCRVCPTINTSKKNDNVLDSYVAYSKNEAFRKHSSSGAVFSEIAHLILKNKGVVIGTAFDEHFGAKQISIDNITDLHLLQGSKYTQSDTNSIFLKVAEILNEGRQVLYVGTPCQVSGLKKLLGHDYSNLFTIDILCHGVPSPMVWRMYLDEMEKKYKSTITDVFFRDKTNGWNMYGLSIEFANGEKYIECNRNDLFMRLFLNEMIIRPSCHSCMFKKLDRDSDITLGDAWGIDGVMPDMYDNKGCSLAIIHTEKGRRLYNGIINSIVSKSCNLEDILPPNAHSRQILSPHVNRRIFFKKIKKAKTISELEKYLQISIMKRIFLRFAKFIRIN